ncbi:MAG: hypothetical protein FWB74_03520 [Defluviitaleaceae bacterium]|nr:hypothetical protein [Defluviitaleaceae bacterium]
MINQNSKSETTKIVRARVLRNFTVVPVAALVIDGEVIEIVEVLEEPMAENDIMEKARKAAYSAVRFQYQKTPVEKPRKLMGSFSRKTDTTDPEADDLIQEAAAELWEYRADPEEAFKRARKAVRRYIYKIVKISKTNFIPSRNHE